jgi:hypothetical protein
MGVQPWERERIEPETRLVYAWLGDEDGWHEQVCVLRAEALEEVHQLSYLERFLPEVLELNRTPVEDTLWTHLAAAALARVQWKHIAQWVLRDADRWPLPLDWTPGKGLEGGASPLAE